MDLSKFKTYTLVSGLPTISITRNGITFSKTALIKLGKPDYIKLMMNEDERQIVFAVTEEDEEGSIKCLKNKTKNDMVTFRINNRDLLYKFASIMECRFEDLSFKAAGEFFDDDKMMLVDLKKATRIIEKDETDDE